MAMKILLAEKDESLIEILHMLLKSFKYEVAISRSADDTLSTIKEVSPDLILIDTNLSDADGLEVSKAIKEDFLTAYIPIIVLIDRRQVRRDLLEIEQGIDDYIIKPPDPIDLQIRIEMAVRRATHQFFANALTRLPGNRTIEIVLKKVIQSNDQFSFGYVDVDRFKYFNDHYGYLKGDVVIIQTSQIISRIVKEYGNKTDFVGHVGGDDFVFITTPDKEEVIAKEIIKEFDRLIPYHYSKEDRLRGYVETKDRQGKLSKIPLMDISIALVNNVNVKINSLVELSEIASEIKGHLKTIAGSKFLKNRRVENKGKTIRKKDADKTKGQIKRTEKPHPKRPLGQLLLEANLINEETLEEALVRHWRSGQNLGQTLVRMGLVDQDDILNMLKLQEDNAKC
ncbi:MAG: response regulator [Candidatus Omnitrophica bacterium]|nr:response regulator [Candidatus Omnitrophota bacterium]MDD5351913.1 response regulator [Candidatus Omnitrophota bacterium]MDD5550739.1 response regulator [Candidatus Omnitrophota bacterium]